MQDERRATEVARRALKIKPSYATLQNAQARVQSGRQQRETLSNSLVTVDKNATEAQRLLQEAQAAAEQLNKDYEALLPVTQVVRTIDATLSELAKRINEKTDERTREATRLDKSRAATQAALSERARRLLPEVERIVRASEHRMQHPRSEACRAFCRQQLTAIEALPEVDFTAERAYFSRFLK